MSWFCAGISLEGGVSGSSAGIRFTSGAALHVENCIIHGFLGTPGIGISFTPSGTSALFVVDTVIRDNNQGSSAAGISVRPTGTGAISSSIIENVKLLNNSTGLVVDGTATTGSQIAVTLRNSVVAGNSSLGVSVSTDTGKALTRLTIDRSAVSGSGTGIQSTGAGADVTLAYSVVSDNGTGLSFIAPGQLRSYQTNQLRANSITNGASSSVIPLE
jgi:hypothetical protein